MKRIIFLFSALILQACESELGFSETITDYKQARTIFWQQLYSGDGETLYCREKFKNGTRETSDSRQGLNVEHVFPMSWVTNALDCGTRKQCRRSSKLFNGIEADLHNLYPARTDVNYARSSFRFGDVKGESRKFGKQCDFEVSGKYRVAEPTPTARGDVARAMFYMADKYRKQGLEIYAKQQKLLKAWSSSDMPSASELRRNDVIDGLQGNRNPFIDNPSLIDERF